MTGISDIASMVARLSDHLVTENSMLREGRVKEALAISAERAGLVTQLEKALGDGPVRLNESLAPLAAKLMFLNRENAALLQAAIAGQAAAKASIADKLRPAGYAADGTRLYPVTEIRPRRF